MKKKILAVLICSIGLMGSAQSHHDHFQLFPGGDIGSGGLGDDLHRYDSIHDYMSWVTSELNKGVLMLSLIHI